MLAWALGGLEREIAMARDRLAALTAQAAKLRAKLGRPTAPGVLPAPRKLRRMSAAARRRISLAMKKRWAERKRLAQKK
jgi:hypothetical protein